MKSERGNKKEMKQTNGNAASEGFTSEEREAMKARTEELRKARSGKGDGESDVLKCISAMSGPDRTMAEKIHKLIRVSGTGLTPRTWYGMPAYAWNGEVLCFFQPAAKFKSRYATLGFSDKARLDEGSMWPVVFALKELGRVEETAIVDLLRKALR